MGDGLVWLQPLYSQGFFTFTDFYLRIRVTDVLKSHHVSISMGGKAAWRDNVFVERLWRSVKYEEVYLNAYDSMSEAKKRIGNWISYYNEDRKHQALGATPNLMYDGFYGHQLAA